MRVVSRCSAGPVQARGGVPCIETACFHRTCPSPPSVVATLRSWGRTISRRRWAGPLARGPLGEPLASGRERVPYYSELRLPREPWLPAGQQQLEATQSPGRAAGSLTQLAPRQSAWPQTAWLPAPAPARESHCHELWRQECDCGKPNALGLALGLRKRVRVQWE